MKHHPIANATKRNVGASQGYLLANGQPVIKHIAGQKLLTALGPWEGEVQ